MGHAENYSNVVAGRMREIADYQAERRADDRRQEQLAHLRAGISGAISAARIGVFDTATFDIVAATEAAWVAGTGGRG